MKKYSYLLFLSILFTLSSCLTGGLEDLPEFEENEISGVQRVEYRYISDEVSNASGQQIVKKVELWQFPTKTLSPEFHKATQPQEIQWFQMSKG